MAMTTSKNSASFASLGLGRQLSQRAYIDFYAEEAV